MMNALNKYAAKRHLVQLLLQKRAMPDMTESPELVAARKFEARKAELKKTMKFPKLRGPQPLTKPTRTREEIKKNMAKISPPKHYPQEKKLVSGLTPVNPTPKAPATKPSIVQKFLSPPKNMKPKDKSTFYRMGAGL